jgi:hypothetical protein
MDNRIQGEGIGISPEGLGGKPPGGKMDASKAYRHE